MKYQKLLLDKFNRGSEVDSLDEVSREIKQAKYSGSRVYLRDKDFPWPADFIILAAALNWKSKENVNIINKSMENVARLAPIPAIFDYFNNHYVGPICGYSEFDYSDDCCDFQKGYIVFWLNLYTYLCKICDIRDNSYFFRQATKLAERTYNDTLIDNLSDMALSAIEGTFGFSGKWRNETQKQVDIYYKVLHILHNAKINF